MIARRPRVGFVGLGWIGRNRLEHLLAAECCDIVALVDSHAAARDAAATLLPAARVSTCLDDLFGQSLDGVVIATPSAQHADEAQRALEHGLAVFCQKPLARSATEARSVVECARRMDRLLAVDLSYRHLAATQAVTRLSDAGELGAPVAIDLTFHNAYGPDKPWYYDRAISGGGCLIDLGVHLVDLAMRWVGQDPLRVTSSALRRRGQMWRPGDGEVEDFAFVTLLSASGVPIRVACSWNIAAGIDAVIDFTIYGERAGARVRNVNGSFFDFRAERLDRGNTVAIAEGPDDWGGRAIVAWARELAVGGHFDPDAERLIALSALIDQAYDAARVPELLQR